MKFVTGAGTVGTIKSVPVSPVSIRSKSELDLKSGPFALESRANRLTSIATTSL